MEFLKGVYERRKEYFENLDTYLKEIKEKVKQMLPDAEVYLYGSTVEGDYSIGLSDIDIAVVCDRFSRDLKLEIFGELTKKFFDSPFEFHVLTEEEWEKYKKFIKKFRKI